MYCSHFGDEFNGVALECLLKIEDLFKVNIVVYSLEGPVASLVRRSRGIYDQTLKLNVYQNHLNVIKDFEKYCAVFQCKTCSKLWYVRNHHYLRHCKTCTAEVREIYPGWIYKSTPTIFEKLEEIIVFVSPKDRYYPYFACNDFESFFDHNNLPKNGEMLSFEDRHKPLSVAIASDVPGHEEVICLVSNGNEKSLIHDMLQHMEAIADSAYEIQKEKFNYVYKALKDHPNCRSEIYWNNLTSITKSWLYLDLTANVTIWTWLSLLLLHCCWTK